MEEEGYPRKKQMLILFTLCLTTMCTMSDFVITPIVSDLYTVFGESDLFLVNLGVTGPALIGAPFLLLSGWLCDRYDRRSVMIAGFGIFSIAAVVGAALENVWFWLTCRLLTGIGWGLTSTTAYSIIASVFRGKESCSQAVGRYDAALSIMGAALAFFSGLLAVDGWSHVYRVYLLSIPVFVSLFFLPHLPPNCEPDQSSKELIPEPAVMWRRNLVSLSLQVLLIGICYYESVYMLSLYVASADLGSEAFTGTLSSVSTLAGAAGALSFALIYKRMGSKVHLPFVLAMGMAFVIMALIPHSMTALGCMAVIGFSWQIFFCYFYTQPALLFPSARQGWAVGVLGLMNTLAASFSSFLITFLMSFLHADSALTVWPLFGIALMAIAISYHLASLLQNRGSSCIRLGQERGIVPTHPSKAGTMLEIRAIEEPFPLDDCLEISDVGIE